MERKGLLLDTSFFVRLLNELDAFHQHALDYYQHFLENDYTLYVSTISIAEYCVKGEIDELPLMDIRVLPFNIKHATRSGEFARIIFANKQTLNLPNRLIIPNDTKLFSQADVDEQIESFVTADVECKKVYDKLKEELDIDFTIVNIRIPLNEFLGRLF